MTLLAKIRSLADEKGISIAELERTLGFGNNIISKWDKSIPRSDKLKSLADYFNVSVDYLLGRTENHSVQPAPTTPIITAKDEKDIAKNLEKIMAELDDDESGPMCYGGEISDTTKELLRGALEQALRIAKIENKEKYTPHKYRK